MAKTTVKKPKEGEETKKQTASDVAGLADGFMGFGQALSGTYKTYRKMRNNPTIALARMVAMAPIRTATYSVVSSDDVPEERVEFISEHLQAMWPGLIKQILYALDYGWMPFEKVWQVNSAGKLIYRKLKPLLVDKTQIMIDRETGLFTGLKQEAVELPVEKCFVFTYDGEAGDLYGRSRHENLRETVWNQWIQISERRGQYTRKVAGVTPMIEYPEGESLNEQGVKKSNFELAKAVLSKLGEGNGVCMPNTMAKFAGDLARSGIDIAALKAWHISFLETKGTHGKGFTDTLRHLESLMMRGWLVPERAATEGQYGTKAESEAQASLALVIADLTFADILQAISWYVVNPLLVYNYGQETENSIWLERGGLDPVLQAFYREIIKAVLIHPQNVDLFETWLDVDAMLDNVGLPKAAEVVTNSEDGRQEGKLTSMVKDIYHKVNRNLNNVRNAKEKTNRKR